MAYYIDLTSITISQFGSRLKKMDLLPSWKVLDRDIDSNMQKIQEAGVSDLGALLRTLKTKEKRADFAQKTGLSEDYLAVLRRVVNGYRPKPNRFKDFPNVSTRESDALAGLGIRNTLQLFDYLKTSGRAELITSSALSETSVQKLERLTNLSRIKWVNHTFAYMLYESGYRSVEDVANADHNEMFERLKAFNLEHKIFKGNIGSNDMKRCVDFAKLLMAEDSTR